ncbi:MAG: Fur family transcriptional regulator, ferric uptake regulator [Patescibacteria group bacterium]|jgi:Fur family ferric uptake transcriptional regulator|nr:Fur family transcriptional regulator, ferric uptake regulator [Patescibacteria group bacterium]
MLGRKPIVPSRILDLLTEHHLLSAPQILEKLAEGGKAVNKTTVYRALDKLLAEAAICKQIFAQDTVLYELRSAHHDHLVCENCGKVEAIPCATIPQISKAGFTVSHHHLTVFGACDKCVTH